MKTKYRVTILKRMVYHVVASSEATASGYAVVAANGDLMPQEYVQFISKDSKIESIEEVNDVVIG
jgi:hypothetical protein